MGSPSVKKVATGRVTKPAAVSPKASGSGVTSCGKYTPEDVARIIQLRDGKGMKWAQVAEEFPGRTVDGLRARYKLEKDLQHYKKYSGSEGSDGKNKSYPLLPYAQARRYVRDLATWEHARGGERYSEALLVLVDELGLRQLNRLGRQYYEACQSSHNDQQCLELVIGHLKGLLPTAVGMENDGEDAEESLDGGSDEQITSQGETESEDSEDSVEGGET